ncbi:MAG: adenylate kinase family protein [Candidatus Hydrothermarchaeota archaeon]
MAICLTGTPGTGKSSACKFLKDFICIELNEVARKHNLLKEYDEERDTYVVDLEELSNVLREYNKEGTIFVGHLSHLIARELIDMIVVLRTDPKCLEKRLVREGFSKEKIRENCDAEALGIIVSESLNACEEVYEVDTTNKSAEDVAREIENIIKNKEGKKPSIDWSEEYF